MGVADEVESFHSENLLMDLPDWRRISESVKE
jgi:hypothetical protein